MRSRAILPFLFLIPFTGPALAAAPTPAPEPPVKSTLTVPAEGVIQLQSAHDFATTRNRLTEAIEARGMTLFATVDHAAGAAQAGLPLRPTTLLLFGNPQGGTPLMQQAQLTGLELPLRVLIYEDADGAVHLATHDLDWMARRHGATETGTLPALRENLPKLLREVAEKGR